MAIMQTYSLLLEWSSLVRDKEGEYYLSLRPTTKELHCLTKEWATSPSQQVFEQELHGWPTLFSSVWVWAWRSLKTLWFKVALHLYCTCSLLGFWTVYTNFLSKVCNLSIMSFFLLRSSWVLCLARDLFDFLEGIFYQFLAFSCKYFSYTDDHTRSPITD